MSFEGRRLKVLLATHHPTRRNNCSGDISRFLKVGGRGAFCKFGREIRSLNPDFVPGATDCDAPTFRMC